MSRVTGRLLLPAFFTSTSTIFSVAFCWVGAGGFEEDNEGFGANGFTALVLALTDFFTENGADITS